MTCLENEKCLKESNSAKQRVGMVVARGWGRGNRKLFNGYNVSVMQDKKGSRVHLGRRQWHPTPVLLPGKSYGQRSLVGCSPWGR